MSEDLFRNEVIEHKRERLLGNVIILQPLSFAVLSGAITLTVAFVVALLFWGNYARRENVNGYLVPNGGVAKIYARNGGTVTRVFVKEGQHVKAGERLLTVSTGRSTEENSDLDTQIINELIKSQSEGELKLSEEQALASVKKDRLNAKIAGLGLEIEQLKQQFGVVKEQYVLAKKIVNNLNRLKRNGHISENNFQQKYETLLNNKLKYHEVENLLISKSNFLSELKFELKELPVELAIRLTNVRNDISNLKQRRLNLEGQRNFTLYAPTPGRVTALQVHVGETISTKSPALAIFPLGAKYEAQLFIPTRAIGFIKTKQKVIIRYAAFPYQRYGVFDGSISEVAEVILSPEEISVPILLNEPVYRVTVTLDQQYVVAYNQKLPLQSGMILDADIILDNLSLIDWILDPLYTLKGDW